MYKRHSLRQSRGHVPRKMPILSHVAADRYIAEQAIKFGICPHCNSYHSLTYDLHKDVLCIYCGWVCY